MFILAHKCKYNELCHEFSQLVFMEGRAADWIRISIQTYQFRNVGSFSYCLSYSWLLLKFCSIKIGSILLASWWSGFMILEMDMHLQFFIFASCFMLTYLDLKISSITTEEDTLYLLHSFPYTIFNYWVLLCIPAWQNLNNFSSGK